MGKNWFIKNDVITENKIKLLFDDLNKDSGVLMTFNLVNKHFLMAASF